MRNVLWFNAFLDVDILVFRPARFTRARFVFIESLRRIRPPTADGKPSWPRRARTPLPPTCDGRQLYIYILLPRVVINGPDVWKSKCRVETCARRKRVRESWAHENDVLRAQILNGRAPSSHADYFFSRPFHLFIVFHRKIIFRIGRRIVDVATGHIARHNLRYRCTQTLMFERAFGSQRRFVNKTRAYKGPLRLDALTRYYLRAERTEWSGTCDETEYNIDVEKLCTKRIRGLGKESRELREGGGV